MWASGATVRKVPLYTTCGLASNIAYTLFQLGCQSIRLLLLLSTDLQSDSCETIGYSEYGGWSELLRAYAFHNLQKGSVCPDLFCFV